MEVKVFNYSELRKYVELQDQIKELTGQLDEIKSKIKGSFGNHGGEIELGGIVVKCQEKSMTKTDMEALTAEVGVEVVAKHQSQTTFLALTVKATAKALKKREAV